MLSLLVSLMVSAAYASPSIWFQYGDVFDMVCSKKTGYKINPSWVSELNSKLPEIRNSWYTEGTQLLKTTEAITHMPFRRPSYRVIMSLCDFPSMSDPLLVNMRYSLGSFTKHPLSPEVTTSIFYHELLHIYLSGRTPPYEGNLKKYSNESFTIREHLFLFSIQKAVYLKLGQKKILNEVIKKDQSLPNKGYAKAWAIVNKVGYNVFLQALVKYYAHQERHQGVIKGE